MTSIRARASRLPAALFLISLIGLVSLISVVGLVANGAYAVEPLPMHPAPPPELTLTVLVPITFGGLPTLSGDQVTVVLTNTSEQTQRVWRESCSWGWSQLSFEVRTAAGAVQEIRKVDRVWDRWTPGVDTLAPGQQLTFTAAVTDPTLWNPILGNSAPGTTTALRAVFAGPAINDAPITGVWTGRIESPWRDYAVTMSEPKPRAASADAPQGGIQRLPTSPSEPNPAPRSSEPSPAPRSEQSPASRSEQSKGLPPAATP